jgi:hypothetical protein
MAQSIYPPELREDALFVLREVVPNAVVAAQFDVPRGTIGYWKHLDRRCHSDLYAPAGYYSCPVCRGLKVNAKPYSYLLGLYLGDGHIIHTCKRHVLSISCADAWPGLIDAAEEAMRLVMPDAKTGRAQRTGCIDVRSYSRHWVCLFPQHGPGKKHERPIALKEWQEALVKQHPEDFIRGLIHSDGCRVTNWTSKMIAGVKKRYEYPRYHFTNMSADIRNLFTRTLDQLGIRWRYNNYKTISVARRESVAALDEFVGPKY